MNQVLAKMPSWPFQKEEVQSVRRGSLNLYVGSALLALLVMAAAGAPLLAPHPYDQVLAGGRLEPPSWTHLFGTDALGRDLWSRMLYGARIALGIAAGGIAVEALLGVLPGLVAGYRGGRTDQVLSRLMDVWLAFPGLLLALVIVSRLGPSLQNTVLALGIVGAPGFYRLTRNTTLSARTKSYVQAAEAVGVPESRILFRHILPNLASPLLVLASMRGGTLLLATGGLSFIGLGAQLPLPEWGALLAEGRNYMESAPWLAIYPGICITTVVIGLNLFGDGLRDWLDPRRGGL